MPYRLPSDDVVAIVDTPPTPAITLGPQAKYMLLVNYESHPPVALLARPFWRLGGVRLDPTIRGRQRAMRLVGISVVDVADGTHRDVALPPDAMVSVPNWAPDGERFVFTVDAVDGIDVWVGDARAATAQPVPGLRVSDTLTGGQTGGTGPARWSRDGRSLYVLAVAAGASAISAVEGAPPSPRVEETLGKQSQMATFQDLLTSDLDADRFEALATTEPVRVDPATGERTTLGPPGLYQALRPSPDGKYLLVDQIERPFSFRVPYPYFARRTEVWDAQTGAPMATVATRGVDDEIPRQGVTLGPRGISWVERTSGEAALAWIEALDGGDPTNKAEHRDRIMRLGAPFDGPATEALLVPERCLGWYELDAPEQLLMVEHDRDRRWRTTWSVDLLDATRSRPLYDHSMNESYGDKGTPVFVLHPDGAETVVQDGTAIYMRGEGATPEGDRPFLHRLDLESLETEVLHRSPVDAIERFVGFVNADRSSIVLRHETSTVPANLSVVPVGASRHDGRSLTSFQDPHPQLTGMTKRLVSLDRGDGVQLTGMLYLPPGHDPERDGRLPLVVWAYPLDYGDAATAGQVRGSTQSFTRLSALQPTWFVLRGYAVLSDATMPVIGDPETMNDTYVEQISRAAEAHIDHLDKQGIIDRERVLVGGHSYGGFMTANLLAHTDLFRAGIARSGAYNRSLTPFGFQTERRNFWEATQVYDRVSPFRYADQITAPLLMVHGEADNNSGTFPVQSERLFQALQGLGGTARLVLLPFESHGYAGRESVLHVLAEQFDWAERWLGDQDSVAVTADAATSHAADSTA